MAELDDKTLQNLNKRLEEMDKLLSTDYQRVVDLGAALKQGFSPKEIDAFLLQLNKINRRDAAKLNVMLNMVDINGKPITVREATRQIKDISDKISRGVYSTSINGKQVSGFGSMRNELERYKNALSSLSMTTSQQMDFLRRNVNRVNKEVKSVGTNINNIIPSLQRLGSAFGVAFSVQGLVQFGKKLIETRGQFEMQFVAMKQIIGDVDAATKIWNQTMQQALQSPFKAMQLVDYTKKLAAYRIETEKLFDTTKRLADVSAGLGVDMQRLIIAYGQVKTANYLRASEVRQFTEAGVNIYGELAKYFSEIEGKAVSTADVVERVTKRMVLFSDVEEIFRRMTDEGGVFFNMQEVQADTVKGQINKLHDAYDQMLNTIGQANQGTIRDFVEALNQMVRNWRDVAAFLKTNAITLATLLPLIASYRKGIIATHGVTMSWREATEWMSLSLKKNTTYVGMSRAAIIKHRISMIAGTVAVNAFTGALELAKTALRTFVPFLAIEGLILLVTKMFEASRQAKQLREDLDNIFAGQTSNLQKEISDFELLRDKIEKTNAGTRERRELIAKMNNQYGQYLDNLLTEKMTVEEMSMAYADVIRNMRQVAKERIMEEGRPLIENRESQAYGKFIKYLTSTNFRYFSQGSKTRDRDLFINNSQAKQIAAKFKKEVLSPLNAKKDVNDILKEVIDSFFGVNDVLITGTVDIRKYTDAVKDASVALKELEDRAGFLDEDIFGTAQEQASAQKRKKMYDEAVTLEEKRWKKLKDARSKDVKNKTVSDFEIEQEEKRHRAKLAQLALQFGQISEEGFKNKLIKIYGSLNNYERDYNRRLISALGGDVSAFDEDTIRKYKTALSNENNTQLGTLQRNKQIKESYKGAKEELDRLNKSRQAGGLITDADIKQAKLEVEALELAAKLRGIDLADNTRGGDSGDSIYGERIRLLQRMLEAYKKAAKEAYGYAKAEGKVKESFENEWANIMPSGYGGVEVPTSYAILAQMLERLEVFTPRFDKNGKLKKAFMDLKGAISDALSQVDLEMSVSIREDFGRQMEEAFNNYELTLDLQKLNLPNDVLTDMFDIQAIDTFALRRKLEELYDTLRDENGNVSEKAFKSYESFMKKIDESEQKLQRERLKSYSKYLEYQLSDRAKIEMEYVSKVAEVQAESALGGKNEGLRARILEGLEREKMEKLAKQDWEDFKGSEMYVQMMEDLTKQGTRSLEIMREKLVEVRDNAENLSPRALKEVINAIEKIDDEFYNRQSPFARVRNYRKEFREAMSAAQYDNISDVMEEDAIAKADYETQKRLHDQYEQIIADKTKLADVTEKLNNITSEYVITGETDEDRLKNTEEQLEAYRATLKRTIEARDKLGGRTGGKGGNWELYDQYTRDIDETKAAIAALEGYKKLMSEYTTLTGKLKGTQYEGMSIDEMSKLSKEAWEAMGFTENEQTRLGVIINLWKLYKKSVGDALAETADYISRIGSLYDTVTSNLNALGVTTNALNEQWFSTGKFALSSLKELTDAAKEYRDAVSDRVDGEGTLLDFIKAGGTGDYIKLIITLLKVLVEVAAQVGLIRDARLSKEIEEQQQKIDDLTNAYARLEKQIERTFDTASYMSDYNQMVQNLREQIAALEAQRAAEEAKKNPDTSVVQGYTNEIQEAEDKLDELKQKQIEVFGGIGEDNYRSWAEGFVDAWKDAFLETGDGLDALQDHFDEFLQQWFVKQATMQIAGQALKTVMGNIDNVVSDDGRVNYQELQEIRERMAQILPELNERLTEFAGWWDLGGEGSLSGLAAGIQGMTEEQANILEAYWNSVRMYTASIDMNVAQIASILGAGGVNTNPMLAAMNTTANNTSQILNILQNLTRSGHSAGGIGIKIIND